MPDITITIDDEAKKIISRRAKKNFLTLREQIEDIIRNSALRTKKSDNFYKVNVDDKLLGIFSRDRRGRKKKVKGRK